MQTKNRLFGLDCLKLLCAFLVICIHAHFSLGGGYADAAARIAVPVFFMITGYFYQSCVEKGKQLRQIKKILILVISCNILYFAFYCAYYAYTGILSEMLQFWFSAKSLLKFLILNRSPFSDHLWYLSAILYVLIFIFLFEKIFKRRYLYGLIPILLAINLLFGTYSKLIFGKTFNYLYTRNFLFVGLPFFLLGDYMHNEKRLNPLMCKPLISAILAATFMATTLCEYCLLKHFNVLGSKELYLSAILCAVFLFSFCVNISSKETANRFIKTLSDSGRKYATDIYIFHVMINICIRKIVSYIGVLNTIYAYTAPIIVFLITLAFAIVWEFIINKIKSIIINRKQKQT